LVLVEQLFAGGAGRWLAGSVKDGRQLVSLKTRTLNDGREEFGLRGATKSL
jgi:hypothetical protein